MCKEKNETKPARRRTRRLSSGNLLVLSCVSFAIACIAMIMGYSFVSLFFVNNRLQASADEIALAGAKKLNDKDRIGQMNNMVARCRQLVYSSRKDLDDTKKLFPHLADFAEPLLQEARDSANRLETERQSITKLAESEASIEMQKKYNDIKSKYAMTLPWLKVESPQLVDISFGRINEVESNVEELHGAFKELQQNDDSQGFIDRPAGGLALYKGELNDGMRLPGADNDLTFKLSSLPAPVDGIIAPARVVLPSRMQNRTVGNAPSVAKVSLQMKVETSLGFKAGSNMKTSAAASTTGACIQQ